MTRAIAVFFDLIFLKPDSPHSGMSYNKGLSRFCILAP